MGGEIYSCPNYLHITYMIDGFYVKFLFGSNSRYFFSETVKNDMGSVGQQPKGHGQRGSSLRGMAKGAPRPMGHCHRGMAKGATN